MDERALRGVQSSVKTKNTMNTKLATTAPGAAGADIREGRSSNGGPWLVGGYRSISYVLLVNMKSQSTAEHATSHATRLVN